VVDEAYRAYRVEKGLDDGAVHEVPPLAETFEAAEAVDPLCLTSISQLTGVNALAPNQTILFHPKLTILFGENATGKTGYVRVLKCMGDVRTTERVLGNVRDDGAAMKSSAQIRFRVGSGTEELFAWKGEVGVPPFTRMNVFDTRAVTIHVDDDLNYTYTPHDLSLFRYVSAALIGVKERLDRDRVAQTRTGNPFITKFERTVSFYSKIETLGPTTVIGELHSLAVVSAHEEEGREVVRERVDMLRSQSIPTNLQVAKTQAAFSHIVGEAAIAMLDFNTDAYTSEKQALAAAEVAHRAVTDEAFAGSEIPGVLGQAWREMIDGAQRYISEVEHSTYPHDGDICVYCRQSLDAVAIELLTKYRTMTTAATRKAVDAARERLQSRQRSAPTSKVADLNAALVQHAAVLDAETNLSVGARRLAAVANDVLAAITAGNDVDASTLHLAASKAKDAASAASERAAGVVTDLTAKADQRKRLLDEESARLRQLDGRLMLRQLLSDIEKHVADARAVSLAGTLVARFAPLLRSLTEATKDASEGLVNADFEKRFRSECAALKAPDVSLDFPGRRGEPARRKRVVPQHKLSDILSEGEQKVIALADFLAEVTLRRTAAPIVFDDPVNSLDYRRSDHVADRIVDLAFEQQIIVFTHNIMLTVALLEVAKKRGVSLTYYDVKADEGKIGLISEGTSPRIDSTSVFEKKIKTAIEGAAKETGEMREMWIERGYSLMRSWCEIFVEVDLFKGVARRFEPNIRLHSLPNIKTERLDAAIKVVDEIFAKSCRVTDAHSQAMESLGVRATLDELKADFQRLLDARGDYTKK
jgi:recombinational DNA repair ATPase RecF